MNANKPNSLGSILTQLNQSTPTKINQTASNKLEMDIITPIYKPTVSYNNKG